MQMMGPGGINRPGTPMVTPQQTAPVPGQSSQDGRVPTQQQPPPPPPPPPGSPAGTVVMTRGQLTFQLGQMLRGQVEDNPADGLFNMRMGDKVLQATSNLDLVLGEQILMRVTGGDDKTVNLQVVRQENFSDMADEDVSASLMDIGVQPQEGNMALAKGMVEMGVPLTPQDFQELQQALARMPQSSEQDVTSAAFLKMAELPMTPENISAMTTFITQNPMLGAQLFEVSASLKKLGKELDNSDSPDFAELMQKVPGLVGEMGLTPGKPPRRKPAQNLQNMAFQAGIERMGPHVTDEDSWDLVKLMRRLREGLEGAGRTNAEIAAAQSLMKDVEENLEAQKLINRAETEKVQGLYYLQVPVRFHDEETTAEVRVGFNRNHLGEPVVDGQNLRVEVSVTTRHLGQVGYLLTILNGEVDILTSLQDDVTQQLMDQSLPHLCHKLSSLGYNVSNARSKIAEAEQSPITPVVQRQTFDKMERINIKA